MAEQWNVREDGQPAPAGVTIARRDELCDGAIVLQRQWRIQGERDAKGRRPVLLVWEYDTTEPWPNDKDWSAAIALEVKRQT